GDATVPVVTTRLPSERERNRPPSAVSVLGGRRRWRRRRGLDRRRLQLGRGRIGLVEGDQAAAQRGEHDAEVKLRPDRAPATCRWVQRSEEHTSELQSRFDLVCRLLLEKK